MNDFPVCVVVGVGPGLGEAYARKFAAEGWRVAIMSRKPDAELADELGGIAVSCDATDDASIQAAFSHVVSELGAIDTLVWNVGSGVFGDLFKVGVDALELAFRTNCRGLFVAAKEVIPAMQKAGSGNIIVTSATAAWRGKPLTTAFAAGKAAQRSLCESLARQFWPDGVHVAMIVVDGMVDLESTRSRMPDKPDAFFVGPAETAEIAISLVRQPRRAWSFQVEARPHIETW